MDRINALIVDDESHSRAVLSELLQLYCPEILVTGQAGSAEEAILLIRSLNPKLVFLDVRMPGKSGFDLLGMLDNVDFEVIFISAFNEFAVTAFDFNALGYVLKPIDYHKLVKCVDKAVNLIRSNARTPNLPGLIMDLGLGTDSVSKLTFHQNDKVVFVNISDVYSVVSQEAVCTATLKDGKKYSSSKDLKLFEALFGKNLSFMRINKNTILNLDCILSYQKGDPCIIETQQGEEFEVSRRKKTEFVGRLKMR